VLRPDAAVAVTPPLVAATRDEEDALDFDSEDVGRDAPVDKSDFRSFNSAFPRFPVPFRGLLRPPVGGLPWEDGELDGGTACSSLIVPLDARLGSSVAVALPIEAGVVSPAKQSVVDVHEGVGLTGYDPSAASHPEEGNGDKASGAS